MGALGGAGTAGGEGAGSSSGRRGAGSRARTLGPSRRPPTQVRCVTLRAPSPSLVPGSVCSARVQGPFQFSRSFPSCVLGRAGPGIAGKWRRKRRRDPRFS